MGLQQFEQRLERLVEGVFSKALRGGLQPVEIARRLTREMDLLRRVGVHGLIAPNAFIVMLSMPDAERFDSFADALAGNSVTPPATMPGRGLCVRRSRDGGPAQPRHPAGRAVHREG